MWPSQCHLLTTKRNRRKQKLPTNIPGYKFSGSKTEAASSVTRRYLHIKIPKQLTVCGITGCRRGVVTAFAEQSFIQFLYSVQSTQ